MFVFTAVFLSIRQGFYEVSISFIPTALFPVFFGMLNNLKNMKKEMKTRGN